MEECKTNKTEKVYELPLSSVVLKEGQSLPEVGVTFTYCIEKSLQDKEQRERLEKLVEQEFCKARSRILKAIQQEAVDVRQRRMFFDPKESFISDKRKKHDGK